jgi:glycosyltransferase involved in cell wall biosynthesis
LGADFYLEAARVVDLDLVGMGSEAYCGLGELPRDRLLEAETHYRFFFNPIRYTSMGLSVCEAMILGLPIVGLATTAMVDVIENGYSGYVSTDRNRLIECMRGLLDEPDEARRLGEGARKTAYERFNMERFIRDWDQVLGEVTGKRALHRVGVQSSPATSPVPGGTRG